MKNKSLEQDLYDTLYALFKSRDYQLYTHNPPLNTKYPYVQLGGVQIIPRTTKDGLLAKAVVDVDVWGDKVNRLKISNIGQELMLKASSINKTATGYVWSLNYRNCFNRMYADNSTNEDLWHNKIILEFILR